MHPHLLIIAEYSGAVHAIDGLTHNQWWRNKNVERGGEWKRENEYYAWKREEISSHPSFNIRFILFRVAGRISGSESCVSRQDRFSCTVQQKIAGVGGMKPEERDRAANFLSTDYIPYAGN